ncbi:hypothetical protein [Natronorubrum sp. DTA7]|uniref:hypothetical protein n=1 Tax=Natronorubrum sp. DTA7 TaxID=3447016 RepID=UPI003F86B99C
MKNTRSRASSSPVTLNPYAAVEWETTDQCLSQFHLHEPRNCIDPESATHDPAGEIADGGDRERPSPGDLIDKYQFAGYSALAVTEHEYYVDGTKHKGEPFFEDLDVTSWPWSQWERHEGAGDVLPIQGAELRGTVEGIDERHDIVSLDNDLGHGRGQSLLQVATEIDERGGVSFLPHPGRYPQPEGLETYVELFERVDTVLGVEAFNARDRYPGCRDIWDELLVEFGPQRPIWAFANDDYHARPRSPENERFDRSRTVLLLEERSPAGVIDALRAGRSYVQYNGDSIAPAIDSITVDDGRARIASPEATSVRWIGDGEPIATGTTLPLRDVSSTYVRAEASGPGGAVSCTQPLFLS